MKLYKVICVYGSGVDSYSCENLYNSIEKAKERVQSAQGNELCYMTMLITYSLIDDEYIYNDAEVKVL